MENTKKKDCKIHMGHSDKVNIHKIGIPEEDSKKMGQKQYCCR